MTQAIALAWSRSRDSDLVGHIEMIKRQMLGRPSSLLLRKRVLLTAQN